MGEKEGCGNIKRKTKMAERGDKKRKNRDGQKRGAGEFFFFFSQYVWLRINSRRDSTAPALPGWQSVCV